MKGFREIWSNKKIGNIEVTNFDDQITNKFTSPGE